MYPSAGVVIGTIAVIGSPIVWVLWWLLADLGERASGRDRVTYITTASKRRLPAA